MSDIVSPRDLLSDLGSLAILLAVIAVVVLIDRFVVKRNRRKVLTGGDDGR